ncbi:MAG: hypothetical protein ABI720_08650 [Actinomycetes bacterium]
MMGGSYVRKSWGGLAAVMVAVLSQAAILTPWSDATAGSVVDVTLMVMAGYGLAANGPSGLRGQTRSRSSQIARRFAPRRPPSLNVLAALDTSKAPTDRRARERPGWTAHLGTGSAAEGRHPGEPLTIRASLTVQTLLS